MDWTLWGGKGAEKHTAWEAWGPHHSLQTTEQWSLQSEGRLLRLDKTLQHLSEQCPLQWVPDLAFAPLLPLWH